MLKGSLRRRSSLTRAAARAAESLDTDFYRRAYPDLAALSDDQLIDHWLSSGALEGRIPNDIVLAGRFREQSSSVDDFDHVLYLKLYPDVVATGISDRAGAATHFIHSGLAEGRLGRVTFPTMAPTRQDDELFAFERSVTTLRHWHERRAMAEQDPSIVTRRRHFTDSTDGPTMITRADHPTGDHDATVLISLYRTDEYLDSFLGNMEEQTAFDRCGFDVVLVEPSALERDLCEKFAARHANVTLTIHQDRVGIYEAWNAGIQSSTARYLTNANADDLRSPRSLELQIDHLDTHPDVDVAYHDMYLCPVNGPSWDVVERVGFRTNFGAVTSRSLLHEFNTPANGPMWRRSLHESIGLFDTSYRSAGDWEFWIRCALAGAKFTKMDTVHFCYFINERGMSRQSDGPAEAESRRVMQTYSSLV